MFRHLKRSLPSFSYEPVPGTLGLWNYATRITTFCLCADDFVVKFWTKEEADLLCNIIGELFCYDVEK